MPKRRMEEIRAEIEKAKERIRRGGLVRQGSDWQSDLAMILAGSAFENAKLFETYSVDSINDFWNKNVQYYREKAEDFVSKRNPGDIRKYALKSDNGKDLTGEFRRYQSRLDELPEDPDGRNYPLARTRVLGIKERMEKGEFDTPEKKRFALSQLIGAREQVGAGRSGTLYFHPALTLRLKPGLSDIVKSVRADLDKLPDEQIDRLFSMTLHYGHGGAMHEEFENLRRTPVEKEIQRLSRVVNDTTLEDDAIKRTAAEMIWLKRHNDLPRQEQQQILQSEDREQEITDILNSPEFTQLFLNNSIMDINNTIKKPDAGELFEKMSEAEKDISSSPYSAMFDEIKNDHAKLQQLTQVFLGVSQDEALTGTLKNGAISQDLLRAVNEVTGILLDPEDKQGFIENMEKTCACLASFRLTNKKAFTKLSNEHPALKTLMDQLPMPKENSAGEFEMALKANILITNRKPDNEVDTTFFRK
ncbi:MAG: hypothetical protein J5842_01480, partial [Lachnospiraceae bacterium]|nr:hypothetical protein [Lachnospiraceae bacterium]